MNVIRNFSFLVFMTMSIPVLWADDALVKVKPFIRQHCVECHGPDKHAAIAIIGGANGTN